MSTEKPETPETMPKDEIDNTEVTEQPADQPQSEEVEVVEDAGVEALQQALDDAKNQHLRSEAEMQNLRRRVERDVENARKYALEKFVGDLLPVVDNLERAIASLAPDDEQQKSVREGIELTFKSFVDVLAKFKVVAVDPKDEAFNPENHQAMTMVENADVAPNTVIDVFQKGYTLNGRLVRPAMVVVSKAPAN